MYKTTFAPIDNVKNIDPVLPKDYSCSYYPEDHWDLVGSAANATHLFWFWKWKE